MFISESVLSRGITGNINSLALLESMSYLESTYHPAMIPIVENSRLNAYVVDVEDVLRLSEETGEEFDDAVISVAESNGIDPEDVILSIDEVAAYENNYIEDLLNESIFYCVKKVLPQNDFVYNLMEAVVNEAWETGDYDFIMEAIEDNWVKTVMTKTPLKHLPNGAKGTIGMGIDAVASPAAAYGLGYGGAKLAAVAGLGPVGMTVAGLVAALPAIVQAYHAGNRIGKALENDANGKSKDFGEGIYFDKSAEKLKKIAQGIDNNPRSYSVRAVASLEKLQTKWANNMQSASDHKQKGAIAKFVDVIGQAISAAKMKIAGDKGKKTKGVHESYIMESGTPSTAEIDSAISRANAMMSDIEGTRKSYTVSKFKANAKNILTLKKPRIFISNKLRQFKGWLENIENNINKVPEDKRGIFMKIKAKLVSAIKWLTDKLHKLVTPDTIDDVGVGDDGKFKTVKLNNKGNNVFERNADQFEHGVNIGGKGTQFFGNKDPMNFRLDYSK